MPSATTSYPYLERTNYRTLPASYRGDVLVWDIDKTYLDTRFSSLRGLAAIPFESAVDKRALPGTVPLLRALRRGTGKRSALVPLYFVSGSPKQLRGVIERKMTLDGVDFDGITFKDQWGLLCAKRPRAIQEQVGYKLIALLLYALETPQGARWLLFGDDAEADGAVFSLFGEVCAGLRGAPLKERLARHHVGKEETREALRLADLVEPRENPVERIFIHLERKSDPRLFLAPRMVATRSFVQTALVCAEMGRIRAEDIRAVVEDLRRKRVPEAEIQRDLEDARDRLGAPAALIDIARAP